MSSLNPRTALVPFRNALTGVLRFSSSATVQRVVPAAAVGLSNVARRQGVRTFVTAEAAATIEDSEDKVKILSLSRGDPLTIQSYLSRPTVILQSKKDCCLCDRAWSQLLRLQKHTDIILSRHELGDDHPDRFEVPVILVNGERVNQDPEYIDFSKVRKYVKESEAATKKWQEVIEKFQNQG